MSGNPVSKNISPDDIDLLLLAERSIAFFKKYKWLFLSALVLGLVAGYLRYQSMPKVYKSRLILYSLILTNQNEIQIVENWNALLQNGGAELAAILNSNPAVLAKVESLKADEIQKVFTPTNPNGFIIDTWVTDISVLPALQDAIVYGFNNSEYVKDKLLAKKERLTELIDKTSEEISRLNATKQTIENIITGKGVNTSALIFDGSSVSRQLVDLNEKLLTLKEDLKFNSSVQVLQNFSKSPRASGPNPLVWLCLGVISCLALAYIFALLHSVNQKLLLRAAYHKESKN